MNFSTSQISERTLKHEHEVSAGERFEFGKNWSAFLKILDEGRIIKAQESLCEMLEIDTLEGKSFLDIGSGSGLFSLAAKRLGARVFSFDFDPDSVSCTSELKKRYFPDVSDWQIEQGSILEMEYLRSIGKFDIVYSWGVLHHTGEMWKALENASLAVAEGGKLFIAIYNDTGSQTDRWRWIKSTYCKLPNVLKTPFAFTTILPEEIKRFAKCLIKGRPLEFLRYWKDYRNGRGMNRWHDIVDWVGGYPYEVAGPGAIFDFFKARGFRLTRLNCDRVGLGCNEFVFLRESLP